MKKSRIYDAERYEILAAVYAKAGTDLHHESVGAYRTKTIRAGEYLYVSCYPLIGPMARKEQEEALERLKADKHVGVQVKYARYNNKRRVREFEQLVEANMERGDLHVACTYPLQEYDRPCDTDEYRSREQARADLRNYLNRIRRLMKRHGLNPQELRWIAVTVTKEHDPEARNPVSPTHHHHLLLHGVPESLRSDVEKLWPFGYCNADRLQPNDKGLAEVAGYVARQEGAANGDHRRMGKSYTTSRNILRPAVTTSDRKMSRRRVMQIAADVRANGTEVFRKIYPEYRLVEEPTVMVSDFAAGAYIYAKLRIREIQANKHKGGIA